MKHETTIKGLQDEIAALKAELFAVLLGLHFFRGPAPQTPCLIPGGFHLPDPAGAAAPQKLRFILGGSALPDPPKKGNERPRKAEL